MDLTIEQIKTKRSRTTKPSDTNDLIDRSHIDQTELDEVQDQSMNPNNPGIPSAILSFDEHLTDETMEDPNKDQTNLNHSKPNIN